MRLTDYVNVNNLDVTFHCSFALGKLDIGYTRSLCGITYKLHVILQYKFQLKN